MRYADQHMHCTCSFDARGALPDMAAAAARAGLSLVCFTDHLDLADDRTGRTQSSLESRWPDFERRREIWAAARSDVPEVRFGMELGEPAQAPEEAARAAAMPGLDLVIASLHNLPDEPDFCWYPYESEEQCRALNHRYLQELCRTAAMDCFDVMGHVAYTARYMSQKGFREKIGPEEYGDELRLLFTTLIQNGRGIECNVSGFRSTGWPFPDEPLLRLYRSLGGEIITVGGDAHIPEHVGPGIREVYALLRERGFRYVCEFRERKPSFLPLE